MWRENVIITARVDQLEAATGLYVRDEPMWLSMREEIFEVFNPAADAVQ